MADFSLTRFATLSLIWERDEEVEDDIIVCIAVLIHFSLRLCFCFDRMSSGLPNDGQSFLREKKMVFFFSIFFNLHIYVYK
jgi:hypothetical protein